MALMNGWEVWNKTYVNLKLVSTVWPVEKEDAPKLVKLNSDYKETGESFTQVSWILKWIKGTHTPAKGKMWDIYWFKAFIEDWQEVYVIESTITNSSKDILNSLLTCKDSEVKISVYLNKNWYPTGSVRGWDDAFVKQAFEFKEATREKLYPKIAEVFKPETKEDNNEWINIEDIPF